MIRAYQHAGKLVVAAPVVLPVPLLHLPQARRTELKSCDPPHPKGRHAQPHQKAIRLPSEHRFSGQPLYGRRLERGVVRQQRQFVDDPVGRPTKIWRQPVGQHLQIPRQIDTGHD